MGTGTRVYRKNKSLYLPGSRRHGRVDMSEHNATWDAAADGCDALLAALRANPPEGEVELSIKPSRMPPMRLLPGAGAAPGSPAAWCAEIGEGR